jgi:GT2 family glycosyltransferase
MSPPESLPLVSIIIVNYNGLRYLDDCLTSLLKQTYPRARWEVILVDNQSSDDSVEHVATHYPWVQIVQLPKNLGFAAGNNQGYRHCRGELIALLNNDTVVEPEWLSALVAVMQEDAAIGGAASKILFRDQPNTINSAGLNLYRDGRGGDRGFRQLDHGQYEEPADVFGACGASVLLRRAMLEDVGFFDDRFFMYCEDLDLAWRAHFRGWRFRYTPQSVVYHVHCGTSEEWSPLFTYYAERNRVFVNLKNAPPWQALRAVAVFAAKMARMWYWVLTFQQRGQPAWQKAWAYIAAGGSLLAGTPDMLCKRFQVRGRKRLQCDRSFAHLIRDFTAESAESRRGTLLRGSRRSLR